MVSVWVSFFQVAMKEAETRFGREANTVAHRHNTSVLISSPQMILTCSVRYSICQHIICTSAMQLLPELFDLY